MQLPGNKMKFCLSGGLLALTTCAALGADPMMPNSGDLYRAGEMDFDAFGSASLGKYTLDHISNARIRHNIRFGAGLGLSYFLTRNIGISADAYSENTTGTFVDSASLNLTAVFRWVRAVLHRTFLVVGATNLIWRKSGSARWGQGWNIVSRRILACLWMPGG